ncbi:MAG: twin-arginine translocation signal domain-containing protein, partial [Gemmatimonadota bacterium]|nr:twin-arginine translocation signal domain-containing protein [Gemmatimonadota bacterium]
MNRRDFVHRAAATAAGFGILRSIQGCAPPPAVIPPTPLPGTFPEIRDVFFLYNLQRNPVTSTYLGGDGYSPTLADANARLRDYTPVAIEAELRFYR